MRKILRKIFPFMLGFVLVLSSYAEKTKIAGLYRYTLATVLNFL